MNSTSSETGTSSTDKPVYWGPRRDPLDYPIFAPKRHKEKVIEYAVSGYEFSLVGTDHMHRFVYNLKIVDQPEAQQLLIFSGMQKLPKPGNGHLHAVACMYSGLTCSQYNHHDAELEFSVVKRVEGGYQFTGEKKTVNLFARISGEVVAELIKKTGQKEYVRDCKCSLEKHLNPLIATNLQKPLTLQDFLPENTLV